MQNAAVCAALNQRTFKGKTIELVQVGHHMSSGAALTEEVDPPDEVCDHLTEGAAVLGCNMRLFRTTLRLYHRCSFLGADKVSTISNYHLKLFPEDVFVTICL